MTSFIGRQEEIAAVCLLLKEHRLVTLTGSGGTGKTRLSLRVAEERLENYPNGAWLVELAPLADPAFVPNAAASALGLPEIPGKSITDSLVDFLRPKRLLLILDNCEHLLEACSRLANTLLQASPELTILASSREFLGVAGEAPFRVPPLSMPDTQHLPTLEKLCDYDAVILFIERARVVSAGFDITEHNAKAVAQIVNRLDGIPLAIELAAARLRLLSVEQIAWRLNDAFRLLTGGSRSVLPRHQTLRALIDWSYDLLSESERILLRRLSVFSGGWTLEASEQVCADDSQSGPSIHSEPVFDLLSGLVDKSLILASQSTEAEMRFRMLETIRQYAQEKLVDEKEAEAVRSRHLEYYLELALQAEPYLHGKGQVVWLDRLEAELDNIRLALDWAISDDIEIGLQLATALQMFWHLRNYWIEGAGWLDQLLAAEADAVADAAPGEGNQLRQSRRNIVRGKALNASAYIKIDWSENEKALPLLEEAGAIFQAHGDLNQRDLAVSLELLAFLEKDPDKAISGTMLALDLLRKVGDAILISDCLHFLAELNFAKGDLAQAKANSEESLALYRDAEAVDGEAAMLALLGCLELTSGNPNQAADLIGKAQSCFDTVGSRIYSAAMMDLHAHVAMSQGDYLRAYERSEAALAISNEMNNKVMTMNATSFLGWEAWALQDYDQAIRRCNSALAIAKEIRPNLAITAQYILGRVALSRGEYSQADGYLKELIVWLNEKNESFRINFVWSPYGFKGMHYPTYEAINALGVLANAEHQERRAATLFGAQDALCSWLKNTLSLAERSEYQQALASTRAELGEMVFTTAWQAGQCMTLEQAVAYALEE